MVRSHVYDLLRDIDHRLVFLDLELANTQVGEANEFKVVELFLGILELLG